MRVERAIHFKRGKRLLTAAELSTVYDGFYALEQLFFKQSESPLKIFDTAHVHADHADHCVEIIATMPRQMLQILSNLTAGFCAHLYQFIYLGRALVGNRDL